MRLIPFEYAARNLGRSRLRLALSIGGAMIVVLLMLAAGAFVSGMTRSLAVSGDDRRIILMGTGSEESIERSEISSTVAGLIAASIPGLRDTMGVTHVSPEVHVQLPVGVAEEESTSRMCLVRGVTPVALLVYERTQIVEGRFPEPGAGEIMIGSMTAAKLAVSDEELAVGRSLFIDGEGWSIVGRFIAPGSVMESEIWMSLTDLKILTRRDTDSCVTLALGEGENAAEFADVDAFAKRRLDLELVAMRETEYYASLSRFFGPIRVIAWATAALIAIGALFGGLNTMYAAFASRVRELGMLQCLGFRRLAIVVSLVQESVLAAMTGSLAACFIAIFALDGVAVRFSMGVFGLVVDAQVLALGLASGVLLGVIGAIPPALRALGTPIPQALKSN